MNALMCDLFSEGYGGEMHIDPERVGITWATFVHLYIDYYGGFDQSIDWLRSSVTSTCPVVPPVGVNVTSDLTGYVRA